MSILLSGGLILVAGSVLGAIARLVRLPTLTGYIAAGVLIGPYVFEVLPHAHGERLYGPVTDVTMALVLFELGGQFRIDKIRGRERPTLALSATEAVVTSALVAVVVWPVFGTMGGPVLLGIMAVAVAPATTIVVLQEYHADGPTSDTIQLLTALSNVWSIFFFEVGLLVLAALQGGELSPEWIAWEIAGSLVYGVLAGYALIVLQDRAGFGNYSLPLLTVLLLTIGVCEQTGVPHMLVFLVTGAVVVNRSRYFEPITDAMDRYAQPAFVAFFVLSGWHLDFGILASSWMLAGAYVAARTVGKVFGTKLGLRVAKYRVTRGERRFPMGLGLVCQAGAAIALAHLAGEYDAVLGERLLTVILGSVVIFELVGPILLKRVVVAAGEVRLGALLARPTPAPRSWRRTLGRVLRGPWKGRRDDVRDLTVGDVMRGGFRPLPAQSNVDEMLHYANHSPFNQFPVVTDDGRLVGMIRLRDLSEMVYDPRAGDLVIAADVVSVAPREVAISSHASIEEAAEHLSEHSGNTVPVVEDVESLRYRGVLERAEILRVMRQLRQAR